MHDTKARKIFTRAINSEEADRERLEQKYGQVWNTKEVQEDFEIIGFIAPFVYVIKKSDGERGMLTFQHRPRFYFDFLGEGE